MFSPLSAPVARIRPFPASGTGTWPCAWCGTGFELRDSWRLTYATGHRRIVCGDCAERARELRRRSRERSQIE